MIVLARLIEMFWPKVARDRRQSSPEERAEFDRAKHANASERELVEQRLNFLEAEVTLMAGIDGELEKRESGKRE